MNANANANAMNQRFSAGSKDLDPQQSPPPPPPTASTHPYQPQPRPQPQRRPRGFAATNSHNNTTAGATKSRKEREREKEKERTKLRERHRRAITSRMLAGLRQYGNFPLPARADMNDVIAALAREAGWTVEPDGTTYRQTSPAQAQPQLLLQLSPISHFKSIQHNDSNTSNAGAHPVRSVENPLYSSALKNCSMRSSVDCQPSAYRVDENLSPASLDSVIAEKDAKFDKYSSASAIDSPECLDASQPVQVVRCKEHGNGLPETSYIPVYVRLASGLINNLCQLMDPEGVKEELQYLKSLRVDGIIVDCCWGIVEAWAPKKYEWAGYREMFNIIQEFGMKLQVVMSFHEHGGYDSGGIFIPLPQWVLEIGKSNQDIFFTDREGRRNTECLSWGIDKERVLRGRTGIEIYFDFMRSFRTEFDDLFTEGLIYAVEIGLGASGELKYPSFSERMGWTYPGIGEFQCYDKYLLQNLQKAAKLSGHSFWARCPDNAGYYNSKPHETGFFCERELTAGYYNSSNQDGYSPLFEVLKKHAVTMKFVMLGFQAPYQEIDEAFSDPESLNWQVLNSAWDQGLSVAGQNGQPCYDREGFMRLVETARPRNHPDQRHFSFFVFLQPSPLIQRSICFPEIDYFIKSMHGEPSSTIRVDNIAGSSLIMIGGAIASILV